MELSSEALVGFAAFLAVGLWEAWRPHTASDASFGWRWASNIIVYVVGACAAGWFMATVVGPTWKTGLPGPTDLSLATLALAFGIPALDLERYWVHRLL